VYEQVAPAAARTVAPAVLAEPPEGEKLSSE